MDTERSRTLDLPADLGVDVRVASSAVTVTVSGDVDVHSAPVLRDRLAEVVAAGERRVEVHLDPVTFMDSTGLGVLVAALEAQRAQGGALELVCGQERLLLLLRVTGLDRVFTIHRGRPQGDPAPEAS